MLVKIQQKYSGLGFLPHLECDMLCHLQGTGSHRIQTKHLSLPLFPPRVESSVTGTVMPQTSLVPESHWLLFCLFFFFFGNLAFMNVLLSELQTSFLSLSLRKVWQRILILWLCGNSFLIYVVAMSMPLELGMVTSQWFLVPEFWTLSLHLYQSHTSPSLIPAHDPVETLGQTHSWEI